MLNKYCLTQRPLKRRKSKDKQPECSYLFHRLNSTVQVPTTVKAKATAGQQNKSFSKAQRKQRQQKLKKQQAVNQGGKKSGTFKKDQKKKRV